MSEDWLSRLKKWTAEHPPEGPTNPRFQWNSRGYLPHIDSPDLVQSITIRLGDSIPKELALRIREEFKDPNSPEYRRRFEALLDKGLGACVLRNEIVARELQRVIIDQDRIDYDLFAWTIMPNHVHILCQLSGRRELGEVIKLWKSVAQRAAREGNLCGGSIWQREYHDRRIRDQRHFANVCRYILENPVKAGLCEEWNQWRWSGIVEENVKRVLA